MPDQSTAESTDLHGMAALVASFQEPASGEAGSPPDAGSESSAPTDTGATAGASGAQAGPPSPSEPDLDSVLKDPRVQAVIQQNSYAAAQQAQAEQQRRLHEAAQANIVREMTDEEYGRYSRMTAAQQEFYSQTMNQASAQVMNSAWNQTVAVMDKLGVPADKRPNPLQYTSWESLVEAATEVVADAEANKRADKVVDERVKVRLHEELTKMYGDQGIPPSLVGFGTSALAPGELTIPAGAKGMDILRLAEQQAAGRR